MLEIDPPTTPHTSTTPKQSSNSLLFPVAFLATVAFLFKPKNYESYQLGSPQSLEQALLARGIEFPHTVSEKLDGDLRQVITSVVQEYQENDKLHLSIEMGGRYDYSITLRHNDESRPFRTYIANQAAVFDFFLDEADAIRGVEVKISYSNKEMRREGATYWHIP